MLLVLFLCVSFCIMCVKGDVGLPCWYKPHGLLTWSSHRPCRYSYHFDPLLKKKKPFVLQFAFACTSNIIYKDMFCTVVIRKVANQIRNTNDKTDSVVRSSHIQGHINQESTICAVVWSLSAASQYHCVLELMEVDTVTWTRSR